MNIHRAIALTFLLVPWLASCAKYDQSLTIAHVQAPQDLVLRKSEGQGAIYRMSLKATGHIDGNAAFTLMLNDKPYKIAHARGKVSFGWDGDWYADTAEIRYEPTDVNTGSMTLRYSFHDMQ